MAKGPLLRALKCSGESVVMRIANMSQLLQLDRESTTYQLNAQTYTLAFLLVFSLAIPPAAAEEPAPRSYVKPIDFSLLAKGFKSLPRRDRELIGMYLKGARRYVLTVADGVFPNGGTEHWRNIAERAHGAAVLAAIPRDWPETLKGRWPNELTPV